MTYGEVLEITPREDRVIAELSVMRDLMIKRGFFTRYDFERAFVERVQPAWRKPEDRAEKICAIVREYYHIKGQLTDPGNHKPLSTARQTAIYLIRSNTDWSLPQIGRYFGLHHTTVLHGIEVTKRRRLCDSMLNQFIAGVCVETVGIDTGMVIDRATLPQDASLAAGVGI